MRRSSRNRDGLPLVAFCGRPYADDPSSLSTASARVDLARDSSTLPPLPPHAVSLPRSHEAGAGANASRGLVRCLASEPRVAPTRLLEDEHTTAVVRRRLAEASRRAISQDFIYGAIDGTVTTFAVVAGVERREPRRGVIVVIWAART